CSSIIFNRLAPRKFPITRSMAKDPGVSATFRIITKTNAIHYVKNSYNMQVKIPIFLAFLVIFLCSLFYKVFAPSRYLVNIYTISFLYMLFLISIIYIDYKR